MSKDISNISSPVGYSTGDYDYNLPEELIAQNPLRYRSSSRLMVLDRADGSIVHRHFSDICDYLRAGDCLVLNNTKVIPARLYGIKQPTGAHIEVLLLKRLTDKSWECLVKPGAKARPGAVISFGDGLLTGKVESVMEDGSREITFDFEGVWEELLDELGEMPLPPYITQKLPREDRDRYQTVYAKHEGSSAAPTAGLHFTPELLDKVRAMGVDTVFVTLHVGLGTFRPVKVSDVREHHMHSEYYQVDAAACDAINAARERGGRVICVGTTSVRTLESCASENGRLLPSSGDTDIFIYPGYEFKFVDGLITNFHLPQSTLLMLVSALAGRDHILAAYQTAVSERYRFFSFGDAMLIL